MDKVVGEVVIIGSGAVGAVLADRLRPSSRSLCVYDTRPTSADVAFGDACNPAAPLQRNLRRAQWAILALPDPALPDAIAAVSPFLQDGALLVETGSVKSPLAASIAAVSQRLETLGINPMFSPSLGFAGRPVAVVPGSCGVNVALFEALLAEWGTRVVRLSAEQHDEIVATVQAASHAALLGFGAALSSSPADLDQLLALATPPFRCLLLLLSRLLSHAPEILWSIQAHNAHAHSARGAAVQGLRLLDQLASGLEGLREFEAWVAELRNRLLPVESDLRADCTELFSAMAHIETTRRQRSERS